MSQQGPLIVVASREHQPSVTSLPDLNIIPVVDVDWSEALKAVEQLQPAAVFVTTTEGAGAAFDSLASQVAAMQPYTPLIVADPITPSPDNALPYSSSNGGFDRLGARLKAALRVRTLHTTVLRRLASNPAAPIRQPDNDPIQDATVLLIGRGAAYPALSVVFGERLGVVGALSIEAAAKHLNARNFDGVIIGEGFTPRVVDALLTVLAEDTRFRNLPIVVATGNLVATYDLPNLEVMSDEPAHIASAFLPLVRQHAFEARLYRTLKSLDAGGLLDPRTGLLTVDAFHRELSTAINQTQSQGGRLSVARFSLDQKQERLLFDAARILSRLMRRMDFGTLENDGSIIVAFPDVEPRNANIIARRLSSVMKHTAHSTKHALRIDPYVALTASRPNDSAKSLLVRLNDEARSAAS
jgi:GGDEF domain-containing protein